MRLYCAVFLIVALGLWAPVQAQVYAAWTQATGSAAPNADTSGMMDMNLSLRVVIETTSQSDTCPAYAASVTRGGTTTTEALAFAKRNNNPDTTQFPVIVCATPAPAGADTIALIQSTTDNGAVILTGSSNTPVVLKGDAGVGASGPPTFVALGDTGCRGLNNRRGAQECDAANQTDTTETKFLFHQVADMASALNPDFAVHLGDYRYDKEWNRTMDMWDSDFFDRVRTGPLMDMPWVFVRGNHEECSLAGLGWFFFYAPDEGQCGSGAKLSPTWYFDVADRSNGVADPHRFVVIDTAPTVHSSGSLHDAAVADMSDAVQAAQSVNWPNGAAPSAWFLMHKPLWAVDDYPNPPEQADHRTGAVLAKAMANVGTSDCTTYNAAKCGLKAVLSAHLHIFQNTVTVGAALPQQIVVGNSGVRMDHAVYPEGCTQTLDPIGFGTATQTGVVLDVRGRTRRIDNRAFGFAHFVRDTSAGQLGWRGTAYYMDKPRGVPMKNGTGVGTSGRVACLHQ